METDNIEFTTEGLNPDDATLPRIRLCRVNLKQFGKTNDASTNHKNYFQDPAPLAANAAGEDPEVDEGIRQGREDNLRLIVNNILNKLEENTPASNGYSKFESSFYPGLVAFKKRSCAANTMLSFLGVDHTKRVTYSTLVFFPIFENATVSALYVMSSGQAYHNLYKITDYDFLSSIPLKIGDPIGALCYTVHGLAGKYHSKSAVVKTPQNLTDLELGDVCSTFTASVSSRMVTSYQSTVRMFLFPRISDKSVAFIVTKGFITFIADVTMSDVVTLVEKLEWVYVDSLKEFPIPENSRLNRLLLRVSPEEESELSLELNENLCQNLQECLTNPLYKTQWDTDNFTICHKFEEEFVAASSIKMSVSRHRRILLPSNPSAKSVLLKMLQMYQNQCVDEFHIEELIGRTYLSFKVKSNRRDLLFEYLRGHFYSVKKEKHYWLLNSEWYYVSADLIMDIQKRFQDILKHNLMPHLPNVEPLLWKPWRFKSGSQMCLQKENIYNKEYQSEDDYYIGDLKTPFSIEYFDIAYAPSGKNETYLYHVKAGFRNQTRVACSQLNNSLELLEDAKKGKLHGEVLTKINEVVFQDMNLCKTVLGLGVPFQNRRCLTYVLGLLTNERLPEIRCHSCICSMEFSDLTERAKYRSLFAEKDLLLFISDNVIQNHINNDKKFRSILEKVFKTDILSKFRDGLIQQEFLKRSKDEGRLEITPKVLLLDDYNQKIFMNLLPSNSTICETDKVYFCLAAKLMLQKHSSYFRSLGAKLEIIRCFNFVQSKNVNSERFKICEIIASEADGTPSKGKQKPVNPPNRKIKDLITTPEQIAKNKQRFSSYFSPKTSGGQEQEAEASASPQPSTSKAVRNLCAEYPENNSNSQQATQFSSQQSKDEYAEDDQPYEDSDCSYEENEPNTLSDVDEDEDEEDM